ncbi:MAG: pyridoxamine 5'-phosphate oxidase family protein [Syntrophorhabdaceae bacterium]|nr:pyridoxamine 5'-phosphate oxidase family protein [Syntrophorhabdaceae bacterium]
MKDKHDLPLNTIKGFVSVPDRLRYLNSTENIAVLATWGDDMPYTSLVNFVLTDDLKTIIFATPRNTKKYKNIQGSRYVALLIDNRATTTGNFMDTEAVTIVGKAKILKKGKIMEEMKRIYEAKHNDLKDFVNAETTALIAVDISYCVHVARFQTVTVWKCKD